MASPHWLSSCPNHSASIYVGSVMRLLMIFWPFMMVGVAQGEKQWFANIEYGCMYTHQGFVNALFLHLVQGGWD